MAMWAPGLSSSRLPTTGPVPWPVPLARAALRFREDHHLDGLLAAVGLRYGAAPMKAPGFTSASVALTIPNTTTVLGSCTVTSPTSAALTRMAEPSTRSIVPRSLTVGACCPQA